MKILPSTRALHLWEDKSQDREHGCWLVLSPAFGLDCSIPGGHLWQHVGKGVLEEPQGVVTGIRQKPRARHGLLSVRWGW